EAIGGGRLAAVMALGGELILQTLDPCRQGGDGGLHLLDEGEDGLGAGIINRSDLVAGHRVPESRCRDKETCDAVRSARPKFLLRSPAPAQAGLTSHPEDIAAEFIRDHWDA